MTGQPTSKVLCFGELLWDQLPHGSFAGGAPFNVAYHLRKLGCDSYPVSSVGNDALGQALLSQLQAWEMPRDLINVCEDKATGVVDVTLRRGIPEYVIHDDVAWDYIDPGRRIPDRCTPVAAITYGSLAQRRPRNNRTLLSLIEQAPGALKVFDVNLRPPFASHDLVWDLASRADVIKLNNEEAGALTANSDSSDLEKSARAIASRASCGVVCVTSGAAGAGLLLRDEWHWVNAAPVVVRDTIGAGDSFTAALIDGLLKSTKQPNVLLTRATRLAGFVAANDAATPDYEIQELGLTEF